MLTEATTAVDGALPGAPEPPRAVMWTVSQIAARDGVSKQAVSKKVRDLVGSGLQVERDVNGAIRAVNVVDYDRLRGRTDDPSKAQAPGRIGKSAKTEDDESYKEALRTKTWHESERLRLDLEERRGQLVRVTKVTDAVVDCAAAIAATIDRLPNAADDLVAAVSREGVHGVRVQLKQIAARLRSEIAQALTAIAADAPETDDEPPPRQEQAPS